MSSFIQLFFSSPSLLSHHTQTQASAHIAISVLMKQGGGQLHWSWKPQLEAVWKLCVWPLTDHLYAAGLWFCVFETTPHMQAFIAQTPFNSISAACLKVNKRSRFVQGKVFLVLVRWMCFRLLSWFTGDPGAAFEWFFSSNLLHCQNFSPTCVECKLSIFYKGII